MTTVMRLQKTLIPSELIHQYLMVRLLLSDNNSRLLFQAHLWSPYVIGQTIYIFMLWFVLLLLLLSFFYSPNLSRRRLMSAILPHMVWP